VSGDVIYRSKAALLRFIGDNLGTSSPTTLTPVLAQQILTPSSFANFSITNSATTLYRIIWAAGHTATTAPQVTFVAPDSGKVLVDVTCYVSDDSSSGPGPNIFFALSTSSDASILTNDSSIVGEEKQIWYSDESDDIVLNFTFFASGLTPGSSYTWYLFTRRDGSADTNRIFIGSYYPVMEMKVRSVLDSADIYSI
jgi:hypothetical protein